MVSVSEAVSAMSKPELKRGATHGRTLAAPTSGTEMAGPESTENDKPNPAWVRATMGEMCMAADGGLKAGRSLRPEDRRLEKSFGSGS